MSGRAGGNGSWNRLNDRDAPHRITDAIALCKCRIALRGSVPQDTFGTELDERCIHRVRIWLRVTRKHPLDRDPHGCQSGRHIRRYIFIYNLPHIVACSIFYVRSLNFFEGSVAILEKEIVMRNTVRWITLFIIEAIVVSTSIQVALYKGSTIRTETRCDITRAILSTDSTIRIVHAFATFAFRITIAAHTLRTIVTRLPIVDTCAVLCTTPHPHDTRSFLIDIPTHFLMTERNLADADGLFCVPLNARAAYLSFGTVVIATLRASAGTAASLGRQ